MATKKKSSGLSAEADSSPVTPPPEEHSESAEDVIVSSVSYTTHVVDAAAPAPKTIPVPAAELIGQHRPPNDASAEATDTSSAQGGSTFVASLDAVTADDLGKPPKKKKKDPIDIAIGVVRQMIFYAAIAAFFISGFQIVSKLYAYKQSEDIYDFDDIFDVTQRREDLVIPALRGNRLQALIPVNGNREEGDQSGYEDNYEYHEKVLIIQGQLQILRNKNKEVVGWIEMPGNTEINYPVVQGADNDWYLHYAYDGTYNPAGSIYLDYRNKSKMSNNRHSIIYGHNMESGSPMFANLLHFRESSYWKDNRYINVYTDNALYTYEVFAAYETHPSQKINENHAWRMNFKNDDTIFMNWIDAIRKRSDISPKVTVEADDRILTLSTCMNVNENRYVVHAVLVEVINQ